MKLTLALKAGAVGAAIQSLLCLAAWIGNPGPAKAAGAARVVALLPVASSVALVFFFLTLAKGLPLPALSPRLRKLARLAAWASALSTVLSVLLWYKLPLAMVAPASLSGLVLGPFLLAVARSESKRPGPEPANLQIAASLACGLIFLQGSLTFAWMFDLSSAAMLAQPKTGGIGRLGIEVAPAAAAALAAILSGLIFMRILEVYAEFKAGEQAAGRN